MAFGTISSIPSAAPTAVPGLGDRNPAAADDPLQKAFQQSIAGLFFGELVKSLRSTVGEPAYLHGGQAEKMFQSQMDQYLVEDLAEQSGSGLVDDLYRQFRVQLGLPVDPIPQADVSRLVTTTSFPGPGERTQSDAVPAAVPLVDLLPSELDEPSESANSAGSLPKAELLELVRQARSVVDRNSDTTPTAVLSGLFRK